MVHRAMGRLGARECCETGGVIPRRKYRIVASSRRGSLVDRSRTDPLLEKWLKGGHRTSDDANILLQTREILDKNDQIMRIVERMQGSVK